MPRPQILAVRAAAAALLCSLWSAPAPAQGTRSPDALPRIYGIEMETRGGRERVLIFAEGELERNVDAPRNGILRLRLRGSVLADCAPREVIPAI